MYFCMYLIPFDAMATVKGPQRKQACLLPHESTYWLLAYANPGLSCPYGTRHTRVRFPKVPCSPSKRSQSPTGDMKEKFGRHHDRSKDRIGISCPLVLRSRKLKTTKQKGWGIFLSTPYTSHATSAPLGVQSNRKG